MTPLHGIADDLAVGTALIFATVIIHAVAVDVCVAVLGRINPLLISLRMRVHYIVQMVIAALLLFLAHVIEVWLWAATYLMLGVFEDLAAAVYFSLVAYTTLGYGDVLLPEDWQLLGPLEAINGLFLVGWSTALLFAIMTRVWSDRRGPHSDYRRDKE